MGKVVLEITMSLDGFVAAPNIDLANPLGVGGMRLHDWLFGDETSAQTAIDRQMSENFFIATGAFVMGRRTFDLGEVPWGDDGAFGMPCFVLTHRPRAVLVKGKTIFTFITDGIERGLEQAQVAAGEKDVRIMGGANVAQQYLRAGYINEMVIHIAPILLGAGTRLFDQIGSEQIRLDKMSAMESPLATHLRFSVVKTQS